jgi:uncharacterized membrane protein YqaE (UPF0057 family)
MRVVKTTANLLLISVIFLSLSSFVQPAVIVAPAVAGLDVQHRSAPDWNVPKTITAPKEITANFGLQNITAEDFLALTPEKIHQVTGKRLGMVKSMELKWAQKKLRKTMKAESDGGDVPQWLYIVLSILFLGWLAIGIKSNWKGNDWWIALLLYFVFYFPGLIYSLIVMHKYY